jgi:hypothetical protein
MPIDGHSSFLYFLIAKIFCCHTNHPNLTSQNTIFAINGPMICVVSISRQAIFTTYPIGHNMQVNICHYIYFGNIYVTENIVGYGILQQVHCGYDGRLFSSGKDISISHIGDLNVTLSNWDWSMGIKLGLVGRKTPPKDFVPRMHYLVQWICMAPLVVFSKEQGSRKSYTGHTKL